MYTASCAHSELGEIEKERLIEREPPLMKAPCMNQRLAHKRRQHNRAKLAHNLLLIVFALNLLGIACFSATQKVRDPLAAQNVEALTDASSLLDSLGFMLMLPGIFLGAVVLLCSRVFDLSDAAARLIWYASAFIINLIFAWKAGRTIQRMREETG